MRRSLWLAAVILSSAALQQTPVFRSGTNLVQVDAIVTGADGSPILDLAADDFQLFDDGQPMPIRSVRLLGAASETRGPFAPIRTRDDEQREASRDDVRVFAILLDDYHVQRLHELRIVPALRAFIEALPPTDLVGVYGLFDSINDAHLTRDRAPSIKAISAFYGRLGDYTPKYPVEEEHLKHPRDIDRLRLNVTTGALEALAIHLGGLKEGRKTLIFVTEGFVLPETEARDITFAANQLNVALYPIDPRGLLAPEPGDRGTLRRAAALEAEDLLRRFATETGGGAIVSTNDFQGALARVARDSSAYYLLAYESPHPDDGKFHKIKVTVKRPRATVRARSGYRAFKQGERTTAAAASAASPEVTAALAGLADSIRPDANEVIGDGGPKASRSGEIIGPPTLAVARGREAGEVAARREFPRFGVLVARAPINGHPAVAARLLGRDGRPLTDLPVDVQPDVCEVKLSLPALGQGDYILELTAQVDGRSSRQHVAFRVTR